MIEKKKNQNVNNNIIIPNINRNTRKPQGRKIQKIDSNDITKVVKIYDSMIYLVRSPENEKLKKPCLEKAIKNNTIYHGYRWNFVEGNDDPNISKALPTVLPKSTQSSEMIFQLNETKTEILDSFPTQKELAGKLGVSKDKLYKIIKNDMKFNNCYFAFSSKCSAELIKKYNGVTTRTIYASSCGKIKQINPITGNEIIFNTFDEIDIKLGFRRVTIKKAIENKSLWGGSLWEYCDANNENIKKNKIK